MMRRLGLLYFLLASMPGVCAVSYTENVKPILDKHCTECHNELGRDPDLSEYPFYSEKFFDQKILVDKVLEKVRAQAMPPGNRPKLNQQQISTIQQWRDEGMGD